MLSDTIRATGHSRMVVGLDHADQQALRDGPLLHFRTIVRSPRVASMDVLVMSGPNHQAMIDLILNDQRRHLPIGRKPVLHVTLVLRHRPTLVVGLMPDDLDALAEGASRPIHVTWTPDRPLDLTVIGGHDPGDLAPALVRWRDGG